MFYKKILYSLLIGILPFFGFSQTTKIGVSAGLNYPVQENNGELVGSVGSFFPNPMLGYQAGVFFEHNFSRFILRPQLMYYLSRGDYDFPNSSPVYKLKKFNFELLLGYEVVKNVAIMAGPAYQRIARNEFDVRGEDMSDNMKKMNLLFGVKFQFSKRFEASLMYDWTLDSKGYNRPFLNYGGEGVSFYMDDARMNILTLNVHYAIFTKTSSRNAKVRRGNRGCYF
ncbi:hypothetical protein [Zunongwangia sp.]|uniref:hypothetical protein n=1 Tax=Zunongwangia sp. TaxID=1965325 RepID=UPI003AA86862